MKKNRLIFLGIFTLFSLTSIFYFTSFATLAQLFDRTSSTVNITLKSGNVRFSDFTDEAWHVKGDNPDVLFVNGKYINVQAGDIFEKNISLQYNGNNTGRVTIIPSYSNTLKDQWNVFTGLVSYKATVQFGNREKVETILNTENAYGEKTVDTHKVSGKVISGEKVILKIEICIKKSSDISLPEDMMPKYTVEVQNDLVQK